LDDSAKRRDSALTIGMRAIGLLAMLIAIVALTAAGVGALKSDARTRASAASADISTWHKASRTKGESLPALLLPIQFKDPKNLGVGKLLVASRGLGDPRFAETVVLVVRYDEKGVLGLILNRRTNVPMSRILDLKAAKDRSDRVYFGGPVEPSSVLALFQAPEKAKMEKAEKVFGGLYLIADGALFEQTLSARPDPQVFHVYLGYAGWTQDQLRAEVQLGAWFIFPADAGTVFDSDPDSLWLQMIHKTELRLAVAEPGAADMIRR
jgi:putative AlgH/UPF0301 family transcriptional regulator